MHNKARHHLALFIIPAGMSLASMRANAQALPIGIKREANFDRFNTGNNLGLGRLNYHLGGFIELRVCLFK
jgi:hypothetical protein